MAEISFHRGEKDKVTAMPLVNGQFIVGTDIDSEKITSIYVDTKDSNNQLVRIAIDFSNLLDESDRITELEDEIALLKAQIESEVAFSYFQTSDGDYITTNNSEKIILSV